jgi:hypothetical protein
MLTKQQRLAALLPWQLAKQCQMIKLINLDEVRCVKSRPNYTPFSINKPDQLPNVQFNFHLKAQSVRDSNREPGLAQVRNCVDKYDGFDKCSSIVPDGAKAMVGEQKVFSGLLRKSDVKCPIFHCIIRQEALGGKSVQQSNCMKVAVKITNLIRGGNRSLSHHKFCSFLEEIDASYGDLLLHSRIRWLSAGKFHEQFFALRREIPLFPKDEIPSDTTDLDQENHVSVNWHFQRTSQNLRTTKT